MYRHRAEKVATRVAALGAVLGLAACSGGPLQGPGESSQNPTSESVGSSSEALLSQKCIYSGAPQTTNLTLKVAANEVAYLGFQKGCTTGASETTGVGGAPPIPCVVTNAVFDSNGTICRVPSTATITVQPYMAGPGSSEKVIFDYSYGYFAMGSGTTPNANVTLDSKSGGPYSTLVVYGPKTGSNVVAGVNGVVVDTCKTATGNCTSDGHLRSGGVKLDIGVTWTGTTAADAGPVTHIPGNFEWDGYSIGATTETNIFTADAAGWVVPMGWAPPTGWVAPPGFTAAPYTATNLLWPTGWDTEASISTVVGASFGGTVTAQGGPGRDVLSGGTSVSSLNGGAGDDYFFQSALVHTDSMIGGDGFDAVDYSLRSNPLTVTIGGGAVSGDEGTTDEDDTITNDVEMAKGGSGNDVMSASGALYDVVLMGQGGDDQITGGPGADDLCGGDGNDILFWSGAPASVETGDYLVGGAGNDMVNYAAAAAVKVCLNHSDANCSGQFGVTGETDEINDSAVAACPRASFVIGQLAAPGYATYATGTNVATGPAEAVDVENLTGSASAGSTLDCDSVGGSQALLPCNAVGGTGADTFVGTTRGGAIAGKGGADAVNTNGGNEEVDLNGDATGTTIECVSASSAPTIIYPVANSTLAADCSGATLVKE